MKRLSVHVSVDNLDNSIKFDSGMFGMEQTVVKPDYAKWMLEDPRINFAISHCGAKVGLNHLGIQVESDGELGDVQARLTSLQPDVEKEEAVACCYANSDKYWVTDPSGIAWETFIRSTASRCLVSRTKPNWLRRPAAHPWLNPEYE